MRRLAISCLALACLSGATPARAADDQPDAAFQAVITAQIEAIGRGDAAAAQSFASPGIKQKYPGAAEFLEMVRQHYAPLVRPKSTHFDSAGDTGIGPMEKITIVDSTGVVWTAVYTFEQVDGQWRITGCSLLKAPDTSA